MGILSGVSDFFGLDIGTTAVRVVQLRGKGGHRSVFRYGKMPISFGLSEKEDVDSLNNLAESIRKALIEYNITTRNVVCGLSTDKIYSTVKEFEMASTALLSKTINFQLDTIVPQTRQESKIDWAILDQDIKEVTKRDVLICSIAENYIQKRLEMLESINLNILAFEPDALALVRTTATNIGEAKVVLDVGFKASDIVITARNQPRLMESINFGIAHILRAVINNMHCDQPTSQRLIFQVGLSDQASQPLLYSSIIQSMDAVIAELRKTINFFKTRFPDYPLQKIVIFGDVVYIPKFVDYLAQQLNIEIEIGNTWQNVLCPPPVAEDLKAISANFGVAAGLAERQVI